MRIPALLSLALSLVLVSALGAATLTPISSPGETLPSPFGGSIAVAAGNGGDISVVVWAATTPFRGGSLFAARLGPGGILDPYAIALDEGGEAERPAVAATADGFVVAWNTLHATRIRFVGRDGILGPIHDVTAIYGCQAPTIAASDSCVLIVAGFCNGYVGAITDSHGNLLSRDIPIGSDGQLIASAAAADTAGFVVYSAKTDRSVPQAHDDLYGRRIDPSGATAPWFLAAHLPGLALSLGAAADGPTDLVTFSDVAGLHLFTGPAGSSGPMTSAGLLAAGHTLSHSLNSQGGKTWAAWQLATHELRAGAIVNGAIFAPRQLASFGYTPSLAATGQGILAVWNGPLAGSGREQIYARFLESDAAPLLVSKATALQRGAAAATLGERRLTAWIEDAPGSSRIVAGSGTAHGAGPTLTLSLPGAPIAPPDLLFGRVVGVAVCAGAGDFLVVWQERDPNAAVGRLMARRVTADLLPEEAQPFEVAGSLSLWSAPRIAFDGTQWLVVYADASESPVPVRGVRISPQGTVIDTTPLRISHPAYRDDSGQPVVAWFGGRFVVAWGNSFWFGGHAPIITSISFTYVARDGSAGTPFMISPQVSSLYTGQAGLSQTVHTPRLTAGNRSLLLTWWEKSGLTDGSIIDIGVTGRLLDSDTAAPKPASGRSRTAAHPAFLGNLAPGAYPGYAVAFDGSRYHLVHQPGNSASVLSDTPLTEDGATGPTSSIALDRLAAIEDAVSAPGGLELLLHAQTAGPPFGPTQRLFWTTAP